MVNQNAFFSLSSLPGACKKQLFLRILLHHVLLTLPLLWLDRNYKLCYDLSVKGCDEDMPESKIPREEAIW